MPELPEVETIKLGLQKYIVGQTIKDVQINVPKIFVGDKKDVVGAKIVRLKRLGKGIIIELNNDYVLTIHLKLTGQLIYSDSKTQNLNLSTKVGGTTLPSRLTHVIFRLKSGNKDTYLYYNDLRRFGWIKVVKKDQLMKTPFFKEMGPEPKVGSDLAGKELTFDYFEGIVQRSNLPIKLLLMDQKKIGGIGNIYANDALYKARIDPRRKGKTLSREEVKALYKAIFYVLEKGIRYGGSSDENYVNALGQEGGYQNHFLVYGRKGEKCTDCKGIIEKIKIGGRGTYFCPSCQH